MNKAIDLFKRSSALRYIFAGGASYAIELTALLLFVYVIQINTALAVSIGFWVGLLVSFLLQKIFTFRDKSKQAKRLGIQGVYYGTLVAVNYGFTIVFTSAVSPLTGLFVARTAALIITTFWNYFIYKKILFNEK